MRRYTLSRREVLSGVSAGAAGLLAGCLGGGGDDTSNEEVHVLTDLTGEQWQAFWEEDIVPGFKNETGIPVNVEYTGMQGSGGQRLATLLQSGDPPACYHATSAEIGDLINQGLTRPVDGVVDHLESVWGETLYRYTMQPMGGDRSNETHMIPNGLYVGGCLNYRRDIYEELGLSVPETWRALVDNAKAIHESEFEAAGFAVPATPAGKSGSDFTNWLYNSGGDVWQESGGEIELWFEKKHVMPVLETLAELAQYSPDPSSLNWGTTIEYWAGGRIAQCFMNNAWLCGPAYAAGAKEIALNTEQALIPTREGADPVTRGWILANGTPIIKGSSNPDGAEQFNKYMFGKENHVKASLIEPMRFLPPYRGIMETDAYRNAEIFQAENGAFLEKNQRVIDEIVPKLESPDLPSSPETLHVGTFFIQDQLVNRVLIEDEDPNAAYEWAVNEYKKRYKQVKQKANY